MAGKGDTFRPVHAPTYRKNFDAIDWSRGRPEGIPVYLNSRRKRRSTYDATMDAPLKDRVLNAYRKIEDEGKLSGRDAVSRRGAEFIKQVWNNPALEN
jgi:hypothetical protein